MKNLSLFSLLVMIGMVLFIGGCAKDDEDSQKKSLSNDIQLRSSSLPNTAEAYFNSYMLSIRDEESRVSFNTLFQPRWDELTIWDESTIVIPINKFKDDNTPGYNRLFINTSDSNMVFIYSVVPDTMDFNLSPSEMATNFTGNIGIFDLKKGLQDVVRYVDGNYYGFWNTHKVLEARNIFWDFWYKSSFISTHRTSGVDANELYLSGPLPKLGCFEPCPRGYSIEKCGHPRDCSDLDSEGVNIIYINLNTITNSNRPSYFFTSLGSRRNNNPDGNSGGGTIGNGNWTGGGSNPKNPIDKEGMDEAMKSALKLFICDNLAMYNTHYTCDELVEFVDPKCAIDYNVVECVKRSIAGYEAEKALCAQAFLDFVSKRPYITKDKILEIKGLVDDTKCGRAGEYERELSLNIIGECMKSAPEFAKYLDETSFIDPCTGLDVDLIPFLLEMCITEKEYIVDNLNVALKNYPHIKIAKNLAADCPKLDCILNKLINGEGSSSDFLCDLMGKFDGSPGFTIGSAVPKTNEPDFSGKTVPSPTGKSIAIVFNKDKCKTMNGINLFETFQHELVHADFYRQLIKDYNWNGSDMTLDATFRALVVAKYGPNATPDQHVLMLNQILPDMINSLMQANGSTIQCTGFEESGDCKHFKTLIINGFGEELLETELGISFQQHTINANEYNLWKLTQPIFINLNTCP